MKTRNKPKWDPKFYVTVYELCRDGLKLKQVAESIGVDFSTLKEWKRTDPTLAYAVQRGQEFARVNDSKTFAEMAFSRLSPELQETFSQLQALQMEPNPEKRAEMLLEGSGKRSRQTLFVHALIHCGFRMLDACRFVGVSRATVQKWKESDPDFLQLMDQVHEMKKDFCEGALMGLVASGNAPAVLFTNRTLNRDRGYDPKITISHEGNVKHQVDISQLNLPVKVLEMVMKAVEQAKKGVAEELPQLPVSKERIVKVESIDEEAFNPDE